MPSSRAFSSSAGVMANVFGVPRTSVNQSWTKRTARSSTVRRTYSCWLRMRPPLFGARPAGLTSGGLDFRGLNSVAGPGRVDRVHAPFTAGAIVRETGGWTGGANEPVPELACGGRRDGLVSRRAIHHHGAATTLEARHAAA